MPKTDQENAVWAAIYAKHAPYHDPEAVRNNADFILIARDAAKNADHGVEWLRKAMGVEDRYAMLVYKRAGVIVVIDGHAWKPEDLKHPNTITNPMGPGVVVCFQGVGDPSDPECWQSKQAQNLCRLLNAK